MQRSLVGSEMCIRDRTLRARIGMSRHMFSFRSNVPIYSVTDTSASGGGKSSETLRVADTTEAVFPYIVRPRNVVFDVDEGASTAAMAAALPNTTGGRDFAPDDGRWWRAGEGARPLVYYADLSLIHI